MVVRVDTNAFLVSEIVELATWYKLTDRDLQMLLLGVSLGLESQNIVVPSLELAIVSGNTEVFLSTEVHNEKEFSKKPNQPLSSTGDAGDPE